MADDKQTERASDPRRSRKTLPNRTISPTSRSPMPTRPTPPCEARPPRRGSRSRSRSRRNGTRKRTAGCRPRCQRGEGARTGDERADRGLRHHRQRLHRRAGLARRLDRLALPAALRFGIGLRRAARRAEARPLAAGAGRTRTRGARAPIAAKPASSKPGSRPRKASPRSSISCRSPAGEDQVDLIRLVRGDKGRVRMHTEIVLRFDYGRGIPWVRAHLGGPSAVAGPNAVQFVTPVPLHGTKDLTTRRRVHGPGRRNRAVHDELVSLAPSRLPLSRPARPSARNRERVVRLVEPLHAEGAVARGDRALADHAEDADLSADRRHRRGGDDLAAGSARRRAQLGLPLLLDPRCDADPVRAAQLRLSRPRRAPGASGCCAPSPAIRRRCRSCTASPASAG